MLLKKYIELNIALRSLLASTKDEEGQDLIEYALLVGFIALIALAGVTLAGESISELFGRIADQLDGIGMP